MPQQAPFVLADSRMAIIGAGHLGQAILGGLIGSTSGVATELSAGNFCVVNPGQAKRDLMAGLYGVSTVSSASQLGPSDIVIVAVRPNVVPQVLDELAQHSWAGDALVVSVAAGVTTEAIEKRLPQGTRVVRAMPNMPLGISMGATGLCAGSCAAPEDLELARQLFASMGEAVAVEEPHMDIVTAISGSGPAYVAAMVAALAEAGEQAGLDRATSEQLALATVEGTGAYMRVHELGAQETCDKICVPGGTTEAAISAMEEAGFSESLKKGVQAAIARAQELGA